MIPVSTLSTYLFCPRKIYLQHVLEVKPIEVARVVRGEIKHKVFDYVNKAEEEIVKKISSENLNETGMLYKQEYYKALMSVIEEKEDVIKKVGINKSQLLEETWTRLIQDAETRANNVTEFAQQNNLFGKELWEGLKPKYMTELSMMSRTLKLRGRIDRVEIEGDNYIPVELKTGKIPSNGMWHGDKIQLGAYILLLQRKYKAEHGFLEYTEYRTRKKLVMNENLREEIISMVEEVHDIIKSRHLPKKCNNKNKCSHCHMREGCDNITMEYVSEEEQESYGNPYETFYSS